MMDWIYLYFSLPSFLDFLKKMALWTHVVNILGITFKEFFFGSFHFRVSHFWIAKNMQKVIVVPFQFDV